MSGYTLVLIGRAGSGKTPFARHVMDVVRRQGWESAHRDGFIIDKRPAEIVQCRPRTGDIAEFLRGGRTSPILPDNCPNGVTLEQHFELVVPKRYNGLSFFEAGSLFNGIEGLLR